MGEATIISSQGEGLYTVEINRDHTYIDALIAKINERLAEIATKISTLESDKTELESDVADIQSDLSDQIDIVGARPMPIAIENAQREVDELVRKSNLDPPEATEAEVDAARAILAALKAADKAADEAIDEIRDLLIAGFELQADLRDIVFQLAALNMESESLTKHKTILETETAEEDIRDVWCADYTDNLSGDVPACEINGELTDIILYPGDCPAEEPANHGNLVPVIGQTAAQAAFNFAIHPGWQKWKPTYRIGTITAIDYDLDTCSVNLSTDNKSYYQNLVINQANTLSDVPISYMSCNAYAFSVDDRVLIRFDGQDWGAPRVIGFESEPVECCWTEPWDGPDLTSKWPWVHEFDWEGSPSYPYTDNSSIEIVDGKLNITIPESENAQWGLVHQWYYQPATPIKQSASKIKIITDARQECWQGIEMYWWIGFVGQKDGTAITFLCTIFNGTYTGLFSGRPPVGCTNDPSYDVETDWYLRAGNSWLKNVPYDQTDYIDLPVTGVQIDWVGIRWIGSFNTSAGILPLTTAQINHIEIC